MHSMQRGRYFPGAGTGFGKRGGDSNSGHSWGDSRGAVSPPSGIWGKAPEAFAIRVFTSTRIANTYVIIRSDFALQLKIHQSLFS